MPRDGSGIYTQPFPNVVSGTTIESSVHNGTVADITTDMNTPRPIVAGGTGANNAVGALANLAGEVRMQQVTNYDTHVFVAGSFFSNAGTTGEPVASHAFMGTAVLTSTNQIVLEARDLNDNEQMWTRRKNTSWGAWVKQAGRPTDLDAVYVNVGGDTMTGTLNGTTINASAAVNGGTASVDNAMTFYSGTLTFRIGRNAAQFIDITNDGASSRILGTTAAKILSVGTADSSPLHLLTNNVSRFNISADGLLTNFVAGNAVKVLTTTASTSAATGALQVSGGVGVNGAVWATNTPKVFGTMNVIGGRGVSYGISSTVDGGVGYVDVNYSVTFASLTENVAVAGISAASTNTACNTTVGTNTARVHCITATTGALVDPNYFHLHVMGII